MLPSVDPHRPLIGRSGRVHARRLAAKRLPSGALTAVSGRIGIAVLRQFGRAGVAPRRTAGESRVDVLEPTLRRSWWPRGVSGVNFVLNRRGPETSAVHSFCWAVAHQESAEMSPEALRVTPRLSGSVGGRSGSIRGSPRSGGSGIDGRDSTRRWIGSSIREGQVFESPHRVESVSLHLSSSLRCHQVLTA
jgi:hypothetical protein